MGSAIHLLATRLAVLCPVLSAQNRKIVLDFRSSRPATNYLSSSVQRRLLVMIGLAAVVYFLFAQAGQPGNWQWMNWLTNAGPPNDHPQQRGDALVVAEVPGGKSPDAPKAADSEAVEENLAGRGEHFPGVQTELLSRVRDDTVFRPAESEAWFHLLQVLSHADAKDLERASLGSVGYLQLDQQSKEYRGRLVTLEGVVRAAKLVAAPANEFGIGQYYQLWLQPVRRAPELVVLYVLQLPPDFPLGAETESEVRVTGFFFKRWAYQSQGGILTAPLVLAKTVDWQPLPVAPPPAEAPVGEEFALAAAIAGVLAVLTVLYVAWRVRQPQGSRAPQQRPREVEAALRSLEREPIESGPRFPDSSE